MSIKIEIDCRELKLKEHFENNDNYIFKNLDIGDIIFYYNEEIRYVIERKTICDLYSSIKDGRYKEQKARLFNNYSKNQIIYLLEGSINDNKKIFNIDVIHGSIINMLLRDNIKIIQTNSIEETIKYIKLIEKRLDTIDFFETKPIEYCDTIKLKKKDNLTPERFQILQLAQIPGISINISKVIFNKYGNICKLIDYLKTNEDLTELINLKNSNRKIGPKLATRLKEFLLH